jgi:hypothetical protein
VPGMLLLVRVPLLAAPWCLPPRSRSWVLLRGDLVVNDRGLF